MERVSIHSRRVSADAVPSSLLLDRRGAATMVQSLILVGTIALFALAGFKALGTSVSERADCMGEAVTALAKVNCKDGDGDEDPGGAVDEPPPAPEGEDDRSEPAPEFDPMKELVQLALDIFGVTDAVKCFTEGDILACALTLVSFSPWKIIGVIGKLASNAKRISNLIERLMAMRKAKQAEQAGDKVADAGNTCKGKNCRKPDACFAPGTLVHTDRGAVPIEELAAGDMVLSRDDETGEESFRPIAQTFATPDQPLVALALEDSMGAAETFEVTAPHPFYVEGLGWVSAGELRAGDQVVSSGGGRLRVVSNHTTSRRTTVYNLAVEDFQTYFVGESAAWVHNQDRKRNGKPDDCGKAAGGKRLDPSKPARDVLPGSLKRRFPGEHLDKSLNQIKEALKTATGAEKKSLQTAKKLLEQYDRLLQKPKP